MPLLHEWVHHDILKIWSTWTVKINTHNWAGYAQRLIPHMSLGQWAIPGTTFLWLWQKHKKTKPKRTRALGLGFELVHYFSCVLSTPFTHPGWDQRGRGFPAYLGKCILTMSSHLRWLREVASLVDTGGGGGPCNPFVSYVLKL